MAIHLLGTLDALTVTHVLISHSLALDCLVLDGMDPSGRAAGS